MNRRACLLFSLFVTASASGCTDSRTAELQRCLDNLPKDYGFLGRVVSERLGPTSPGFSYGHDCPVRTGFVTWTASSPLAKAAAPFESPGWQKQGGSLGPNQLVFTTVAEGRKISVTISCAKPEGVGVQTGNAARCSGLAAIDD